MADHTTWRVYCRNGDGPCMEPLPRLARGKAARAAQDHTNSTGHSTEVTKIQFTVTDRFSKETDGE